MGACAIDIIPTVGGVPVTDYPANAAFITDEINIELPYSWNLATCGDGFDMTGLLSVEVPCGDDGEWVAYDNNARSVEFADIVVFRDNYLPYEKIRVKFVPFGNTTGTVSMKLTLKRNV